MITYEKLGKYGRFGNQLFQIASTIGYAVKNDIPFGFPEWEYQKYFKNPLPVLNGNAKSLTGYLQDYRNFEHCKDLIKFYFEMNILPLKIHDDFVFVHYRDYEAEGMSGVHPVQTKEYYKEAMKCFKKKKFVIFSDNIEKARDVLDIDFYHEGDEIDAFWFMKNCAGGICANSSFSWWAGYLCGGKVVLPSNWFAGRKKGLDTSGYYFPGSIMI